MFILYLLLALFVLLAMVTIHEFGHYCAGKLLHFKINEFSIGFGKSLYSHTSKKTGEVFSIRLVPLGGYCAFDGEDGEDPNKQSDGAFTKMAPWKRLIVLFCGPFFNILSAVIFSIVLLCTTGYDIPKVYQVDSIPVVTAITTTAGETTNFADSDKIVEISQAGIGHNSMLVDAEYSSPSYLSYEIKKFAEDNNTQDTNYLIKYYRGGEYYSANIAVEFKINTAIKADDVIWKVNGTTIDFANDNTFANLIKKAQGDSVTLTVKRDGQYKDVVVNLFDYGVNSNTKVVGITSTAYKFTLGESLARCVPFTFGLAYKVLESLWLLVSGQLGLSAVGGPITTITTIATYTQSNFASFFILLPLIAVNLGVFNLLPIPALDGSKMVFTTIEWIRGKPINPKIENAIHNIGFLILMGLVVIADLYHLFFV